MTPRLIIPRALLPGLILVGLVLVPALLAPWLPLADPALTAPRARMLPPLTAGHLLGTDQLGRDLLSRLLWGARSSIAVGLIATLTAALIGSLIGLLAGWLGRLADTIAMRSVDVLMAFPYLLLALAIVAALGPGLGNAMIAIAVANVPFFARAVRATTLDIRHQDYVQAARLAGHGESRILVFEVLPNLAPTVLILMTTTLGWMVLETAGLSFLGLGAQPPQADLGSMLGEGREFLTTYPRVAVLPGLVILVLVVGINLLGDALRDQLDPRLADGPKQAVHIAAGTRRAHRAAAAMPDNAGAPEAGDHADPAVLLRVRGLGVSIPRSGLGTDAMRDLVAGLDFDLHRGERVALVGESGSGKTLTALALMRLLPASAQLRGSILLASPAATKPKSKSKSGSGSKPTTAHPPNQTQDLAQLPPSAMRRLRGRRLAYVPQEPLTALDPLFRVGSQLEEALRAHPTDAGASERLRALIRQVDLAAVPGLYRRYPHRLSGGQRQRIAIVMALLHQPDLLIADEATTALDVTVQQELLALLRRLCSDQGQALLFVSHDLAVVAGLCTRVLVMYAGRLVEDADIGRILQGPAHPYTAALLACSPELGRPAKPLPAIPGQPPGADARIIGCSFAPRCERVQPVCRQAEPALTTTTAGHRVRCLFPLPAPAADTPGRVASPAANALHDREGLDP